MYVIIDHWVYTSTYLPLSYQRNLKYYAIIIYTSIYRALSYLLNKSFKTRITTSIKAKRSLYTIESIHTNILLTTTSIHIKIFYEF